jgi:hypothetical protein
MRLSRIHRMCYCFLSSCRVWMGDVVRVRWLMVVERCWVGGVGDG